MEEVAAAKDEVSAVQRRQHQDALESLQDGYKAHKGELEGQLEYYKQGFTEKDTFEKTVRKLKADRDQVLSSLTREQEQRTAIHRRV